MTRGYLISRTNDLKKITFVCIKHTFFGLCYLKLLLKDGQYNQNKLTARSTLPSIIKVRTLTQSARRDHEFIIRVLPLRLGRILHAMSLWFSSKYKCKFWSLKFVITETSALLGKIWEEFICWGASFIIHYQLNSFTNLQFQYNFI